MSGKRPLISDKQIYEKVDFGLSKRIATYRECKNCGKFSKPSRGKTLTWWDTHCRNCGAKLY